MPPSKIEKDPQLAKQLEKLQPVIDRIDTAIQEFIQMGASSDLSLSSDQICTVIDSVINETGEGKELITPEEYFMDALRQDIEQLQPNTYEEITLENGKTEFRPLRPETWVLCLKIYQSKFLKA
ncbi:MAG: hypothetical protein AAFY98_07865 [Verrucomicrobiota bacterium]